MFFLVILSVESSAAKVQPLQPPARSRAPKRAKRRRSAPKGCKVLKYFNAPVRTFQQPGGPAAPFFPCRDPCGSGTPPPRPADGLPLKNGRRGAVGAPYREGTKKAPRRDARGTVSGFPAFPTHCPWRGGEAPTLPWPNFTSVAPPTAPPLRAGLARQSILNNTFISLYPNSPSWWLQSPKSDAMRRSSAGV